MPNRWFSMPAAHCCVSFLLKYFSYLIYELSKLKRQIEKIEKNLTSLGENDVFHTAYLYKGLSFKQHVLTTVFTVNGIYKLNTVHCILCLCF